MPTTQNVDRIIKDYTNRKQYPAAHLFFIEGRPSNFYLRIALLMTLGLIGLSEQLFVKLTSSSAEPHLQALKELFLNFNGL